MLDRFLNDAALRAKSKTGASQEVVVWMFVGIVLAITWTTVLRVGSQISLFLAPAAAAMLVLGYLGFPFPGNYEITPPGYKSARTIAPDRKSTRLNSSH